MKPSESPHRESAAEGHIRTISVSPSYVRKSLSVALLAGMTIPIGLVVFTAWYGFVPELAGTAVVTVAFLIWVLVRTYRRGLQQAIHLGPTQIVFDYITYRQEYTFCSAAEWRLDRVKSNWRITELKHGDAKLIPVSAFPQLAEEMRRFYGNAASRDELH